ncbi:hypothetical protein QF049_003174 [Paenibacillus sp. W4I10]|uniref:hypothetical protein n=1 Tax=Paenibacillus sp. W4I10 TaxID=3042298 RepID=UPI00278B7763|nr:hypothetical protein [Paenibacillus sp. W4I10]MDQ0721913.1 hypothetical protein [Paenibacillus sp. W4I10]
MWDFIDGMIKIMPLIVAAFAIARFMITTMNKSIIEIILTPNIKKHWEGFYELVVLSFIVTAGISVPGFIKSPLSDQVINILFFIDLIIVFVTGITVFALLIINIWKDISGKKKLIDFIVLGNFISIVSLMALSFTLYKVMNQVLIDHQYSELLFVYMGCTFFIFSLFQLYSIVYRTLTKPKKKIYQMESIESSKINEELKSLKFEFMLDDERHVLSGLSLRSSLDLPLYIYYPKEEKLIKYFRIER